MAGSKKKGQDASRDIVLSGTLSLPAAGDVRKQLEHALEESDHLNIVLRDVEEIDLSLVQLLCAAHRSAIARRKVITLDAELPEAFQQLLNDAGLQQFVGCFAEDRQHCIWTQRSVES